MKNHRNRTITSAAALLIAALLLCHGALAPAARAQAASAESLVHAVTAVLPLSWFSEMDSLNQRHGIRYDERGKRGGTAAWARVRGEKFNFNKKLTGATFGQFHYAAEAGLDYKITDGPDHVYLGAFAGCGRVERDCSARGDATSDSAFGGISATIIKQNGWYVDAVGKYNNFKNRFTVIASETDRAKTTYHNSALGGSLEIGKYIEAPFGLSFKPQIQAAFTTITGATCPIGGFSMKQHNATTARARAGFMLGHVIDDKDHGIFIIYLKAYYGQQWTTDGKLYVTPAAGGASSRFITAIKGDSLEAGAGVSWYFTRFSQLYLDYSATKAEHYKKPLGINLGIRHSW